MPKVVTTLTETRSSTQGFCEQLKNQGQRLNPQFITIVTKGWANLGLSWHEAIQRIATSVWPVINDVTNRPFVSTTDLEVIDTVGDPNVGYCPPGTRPSSWALPGMGPDDVVLWHTSEGGPPIGRMPSQS